VNFKIGDRVISIAEKSDQFGYIGTVYSIDLDKSNGYQLRVKFDIDSDDYALTPDGRPYSDLPPSIRLLTPLEEAML
jgi:hypothetical protein